MTSIGISRKSSVAWIAGKIGTPVGVATYRVQNLTPDIEKAIVLAETSMVGEFQNAPARVGGRYIEFGFTTELRGSDIADTPPPDGVMLRGCGFAETVNGTTPNEGFKYVLGNPLLLTGTPIGVLEPIDFEIYQHGLYRKADNCVGSVKISFLSGQIPIFDWNWRGQVEVAAKGGVTDYSPPAFSVQPNPKPVQSAGLEVVIARSGTVTGSVSGASSTTVLIDATATFNTSGVMIGDLVTLDVGTETATVVSIQGETQLTSTTLSAAGSYDDSEAYTITRAGRYQGTVSGASSPTVLIDASATFITSNVLPGDTIELDVGGETATVVTVDSEIQITSTVLSAAGEYDDSEAYTIMLLNLTTEDLVVPSLILDIANIIPGRGDMNGAHGFSQTVITGRAPVYTMQVEVPSLHTFNFEREYIEGTTLDVSWHHEVGLGDIHAMDNKFSGVINSMPVLSEVDGKNIYTIVMDQAIESGADPLELSWQGT